MRPLAEEKRLKERELREGICSPPQT